MSERRSLFTGDDPFQIARSWLSDAEKSEPNDANAMALATANADGLPNVRMVLLKDIEDDGFVFYTNYESTKGQELAENAQAAFVLHWKTLGRQVRVRGLVSREEGEKADEYYASRGLKSRLGAWASQQSRPLSSREVLMADVARVTARHGTHPDRPPFWGGFRIQPLEMEFWADGQFRLHDRFRWQRNNLKSDWVVQRLNP